MMLSLNINNIVSAVKAFTSKIDSGEIVLPDNLPAVDDTTIVSWPNSIVYGSPQVVIQINYDENTNTVSLNL